MMKWEVRMNQDSRAWEQQFDSNFGPKELLRFLGVFAGWLLLGLVLSVVTTDFVLFYPFLLTAFAFPFACRRWRPAYALLRLILGNKNLPPELMPTRATGRRSSGRRWRSLVMGAGFWLLVIVLLYLVVRSFFM
jgi:hypothetical protein